MFRRLAALLVLSLVLVAAASAVHPVRAGKTTLGSVTALAMDGDSVQVMAPPPCRRGALGAGLLQAGSGHCLHAVTLPGSETAAVPLPDSTRVAWRESPAPLRPLHIAPSLPPPVSAA